MRRDDQQPLLFLLADPEGEGPAPLLVDAAASQRPKANFRGTESVVQCSGLKLVLPILPRLRLPFAQFETPFTIGWLYNLLLTAVIRWQWANHKSQEMLSRIGAVNECWSVRHVDETVTCEMFGYKNVDE